VRPDRIVLPAPLLHQDLNLPQRIEDLPVDELVLELAVQALVSVRILIRHTLWLEVLLEVAVNRLLPVRPCRFKKQPMVLLGEQEQIVRLTRLD